MISAVLLDADGVVQNPGAFQSEARPDWDGLRHRAGLLRRLLAELDQRLDGDGLQAQLGLLQGRPFSGLGFASNMDQWRSANRALRQALGARDGVDD